MNVRELINKLITCDLEATVVLEEYRAGPTFYARDIDVKTNGNIVDGGPFLTCYGPVIKESNVKLSQRVKDQ